MAHADEKAFGQERNMQKEFVSSLYCHREPNTVGRRRLKFSLGEFHWHKSAQATFTHETAKCLEEYDLQQSLYGVGCSIEFAWPS